jgi:hypothetical protein
MPEVRAEHVAPPAERTKVARVIRSVLPALNVVDMRRIFADDYGAPDAGETVARENDTTGFVPNLA